MLKIPQNQFKELISVCKETETIYEIEKGIGFDFVKIGKVCFSCSKKTGQILYSFKEGQKVET